MPPHKHPLQGGSFDPLALLRRARASGNVPEQRAIMLRMMWLRQQIPEAQVETTLAHLDERSVVMAASIILPDGGRASGHAAADIDESADRADVIELTETRAIGRALDVLGYVVIESSSSGQRSSGASGEPQQRSRAPQQPPEHVQALRQMKDRDRPPAVTREQLPEGAETGPSPGEDERDAGNEVGPAQSRAEQNEPGTSGPSADRSGDPELEDVSWTAFWDWARATYHLGSRLQLENLLGQPVGNRTPAELRILLQRRIEEAQQADS